MNKKKIVLIVIACFLVLTASYGITYAYLISKDAAVNDFTVGENNIEVHENFEPPEKMEPKISFKKEPYVENTGNIPCFVRMRADFSDSKAEDFCELDFNTEDWTTKNSDGYYYYKKLLGPGKETEALFKNVTIKENKKDGSKYTESDMIDFDILIYAESCQHTDHDGSCFDDEYETVWK